MATYTINVLLSSFPGLGLPSTLCIPTSSHTSIADFTSNLSTILPPSTSGRLLLTTHSGKRIHARSPAPVSTLCAAPRTPTVGLRLTAPLHGGKGGFGSQLRAAGGRMSSRKKRAQGENSGSSRNLDGRRLRTVTEAKALAEYLAVRPEMEAKEREERRRRWEAVVEAADRREAEIKEGGGARARVDGRWAEEKEEAEGRVREAVTEAMKRGLLREHIGDDDGGSGSSEESESEEEMEDRQGSSAASSKGTTPPSASEPDGKKAQQPRKVFGWDEEDDEDEDMSDSSDDEEQAAQKED